MSVGVGTVTPVYNADAFRWLTKLAVSVEMFAESDAGDLDTSQLSVLHHFTYLMLSLSKHVRLNEFVADCLGIEAKEWSDNK